MLNSYRIGLKPSLRLMVMAEIRCKKAKEKWIGYLSRQAIKDLITDL